MGEETCRSSSGRYKLMSPAKLPISRSPYNINNNNINNNNINNNNNNNIAPGLSPTSFLESPVLLSNIKAEPSPTTGSFMNPQLWPGVTSGFSSAANCSKSGTDDERRNAFFEYKPHNLTDSYLELPPAAPMKSPGTNNRNSEPHDQMHQLAVIPAGIEPGDVSLGRTSSTAHEASQSDHNKDMGHPVTSDRSSDDGYNWRKYGQKLVKGCEFPRSYYKCTHPNCDVKKIFERSYEGKITEIVYKGTHDHPKPQPARRFTAGAIMCIQEQTDHVSSIGSGEDQSGIYGLNTHTIDPNGTPQQSPRGINDNCMDGSQLNGINGEGGEDDPYSKRRKFDEIGIDVIPVVKPIREPRVVVQTMSEVDILDDGYRWRKYGQKVVRGNPNPRSYYKCTSVGCPVRKHVERAAHDPKAVITTYEGKHNHDVPIAKNSSHDMAGSGQGPGAGHANINPMSSARPDMSHSISLDLGVGISHVSENRPNERQHADSQPMQFQANRAGSIHNTVQMSPMPSFYGIINGNPYVSGESPVRHNFPTSTINHSANHYPQNVEGVPLGP